MTFKAAAIQINSVNDMVENVRKASFLAKQAADAGATLVTMPENVAFMAGSRDELYANAAYMEEHPALEIFQEVAKNLEIHLLIGSLAVKVHHSEKLANRSILLDQHGEIVTTYDKIHMYDATVEGGESHRESERFEAGKKPVMANLPECKLGLTICYDLRFPYLYRDLALKGAEVVVAPSAFTKFTGEPHWEVLLRARAIENGCYMVAAAQTGDHPANRKTWGHAMIVDPWGSVIADAGEAEGFAIAEIDVAMVGKVRENIPSLKNGVDLASLT